MANYEKPFVLLDEGIGEGVFMASGSSDCWTVSARSVQDWNGSHNVFEVSAVHSTSVVHISSNVEFKFTFSQPVTDAYSEFPSTFSGNTVVVNRNLHANAYNSGDRVTFKVWVKAADEATTKGISCNGITYKCTHETNVQGGID